MKAVVQDRYGEAEEVLRLEDIEPPDIAPDEVLVRVVAAGVDRSVWHLMTGRPYMIRLAGFGLSRPKNRVRGVDVAGMVEAVGSEVEEFKPGDEAYGIANGSFAELAAAEAKKLAPKPKNLSFEEAAVLPVSGLAALQGLRDKGGIKAGQKVLVVGASGGVGSLAVQIAKAHGAEVTGVTSGAKGDMVRSIGADRVIDYEQEDFTKMGDHYDLILDTGGTRKVSDLRRTLTPDGTLVIVGGEEEGRLLGGFDRQIGAMLISPIVSQTLISMISSENGEDIRALTEFAESGELKPSIERTFGLSQVPEAIVKLRDGAVRGKVAVSIGPEAGDGYSGRTQQSTEE